MSALSVQPVPPPLRVQHDGLLTIATGRSRRETSWKHRELLWSDFLKRLANPQITGETLAEYRSMPKSQQDAIKDVGGFVGGTLHGGRRKAGAVKWRQLVTLDADHVQGDLWETVEMLCDFASAIYSTHSHSPERPRLRLVIPLSRPVTADEYQAVSRRLAADLGIDQFDETTYEPHRLMYWPSTPRDAEYEFRYQDLRWLDPDQVLAGYPDWRDPSFWPESTRVRSARQRLAERQEDPHEKTGIVGAFCRTYSVEEAIETFLEGIYSPAGDGRYTYAAGTTFGGLIVYDDGKFVYSHHGTDPVGGRLVNAFDLVRLHRFGGLDDEAEPGTPVVRMPSYTAMAKLASDDERVRQTLGRESQQRAVEEFGAVPVADDSWMARLEVSRKGKVLETRQNILLILEHDPRLAGRIALNEFTGRPAVRGDLPWRKAGERDNWNDRDDDALRHYLEHLYQIDAPGKTSDALGVLLERHKYHPVRDYLGSLSWDGIERLDSLLIDYLGAEDSAYVRAVTRKALTAAVARVMHPGCKYDYMLVLVGPQGIGKSLLLNRLGRHWFSDSLTTVTGKEAYEQLQGSWIVEMGELAATRKAEVEAIKHFLSKREDIYRVAYGRQVSVFPRQCVFFGSTNDATFLRDRTGNRRFWPVTVGDLRPPRSLWTDLTDDEIDQVWAEAVASFKAGEPLYLKPDLEVEARRAQEAHTEESDKAGAVREYLERLLPAEWDEWDMATRREYLHGGEFGSRPEGTVQRQRVCVMEVWVEQFFGDPKQLTQAAAREIHDILRSTAGWQPYTAGTGKLKFGSIYGYQRAYVRTKTDVRS